MSEQAPYSCPITKKDSYSKRFSICTLVTDKAEYEIMLRTFVEAGFTEEDSEFLHVDNSRSNTMDAFEAYRHFLSRASGRYIILCHQDIELLYDKRDVLEKRIEEISLLDSKWALLGNAGMERWGKGAAHISHPTEELKFGKFPSKAISLDENFIVANAAAQISISSDLEGFHLYGVDMCMIANIIGFNSYVIDFHLLHKSEGNPDHNFQAIRSKLISKYGRLKELSHIQTTCTRFSISGDTQLTTQLNSQQGILATEKKFQKIAKEEWIKENIIYNQILDSNIKLLIKDPHNETLDVLSIIIIGEDRDKLAKTIASIKNQTYNNWRTEILKSVENLEEAYDKINDLISESKSLYYLILKEGDQFSSSRTLEDIFVKSSEFNHIIFGQVVANNKTYMTDSIVNLSDFIQLNSKFPPYFIRCDVIRRVSPFKSHLSNLTATEFNLRWLTKSSVSRTYINKSILELNDNVDVELTPSLLLSQLKSERVSKINKLLLYLGNNKFSHQVLNLINQHRKLFK